MWSLRMSVDVLCVWQGTAGSFCVALQRKYWFSWTHYWIKLTLLTSCDEFYWAFCFTEISKEIVPVCESVRLFLFSCACVWLWSLSVCVCVCMCVRWWLALTAWLIDDRAWNAMIVYWKLRQLYMLHDVFRIQVFRQNNTEQNSILSKVHSSKRFIFWKG